MTATLSLSICSERLNYLANSRTAASYLEIGVSHGNTFFKIPLSFKVAVDPAFPFDYLKQGRSGEVFFPVTSDEFFAGLTNQNSEIYRLIEPNFIDGKVAFDLIFIDGLHTFEQTLRDFENSLKFSHDHTIWVLDDTIPFDEYSAIPDMSSSLAKRKKARMKGMPWHGDVFKVIPAIHDSFPEHSYCTLIEGNPQTVIWKANRRKIVPAFASNKTLKSMSCYDIARYVKLYMLSTAAELPNYLGQSIEPETVEQPDALKRLNSIFYSDTKLKFLGRILKETFSSFIARFRRSIRKRMSS
ncbi:MAG: class I SAM-dependent methyltransferase [Desulfovibrio sp.]|nr:class I SAM-dependent methyltransferase [Desulfovibrio sp.]